MEHETYHWLYVGLVLQDFAGLCHSYISTAPLGCQQSPARRSRTFSHSLWTSLSANCLQLIRLSIQPSRVGIVAGSEAGAEESCMGSGILTSSMLVSMAAGRWQCGGWGGGGRLL